MDGILKVSPEQLTSTAAQFSTCGTTIRNITASMTDLVSSLSPAWAGEDASAYIAKFNGLQDDINRIHAMIQEHIADLTEMADIFNTVSSANLTEIEALSSDVIV